MVGTITVSGYGASYRIRLSPGNRPSYNKISHGNSNAVAEAAEAAILRMRAENGGTIGSAVEELKRKGFDVELDDVDLTQTGEDVENAEADLHQLVIRGIERPLWQQVRAEAVRAGKPAGALLNEIMREWLARRQG